MKSSPLVIFIGALALGVVLTLGYGWLENPAPPLGASASQAALLVSPAHGGATGSGGPVGVATSGGSGVADQPAGEVDRARAISSVVPSNGGSGSRAFAAGLQPGEPARSLEAGLQSLPAGSGASSAGVEPSATPTNAGGSQGIAAGAIPLPPIPVSGQVPLAFRPLAPALGSNPQLADGVQTLQQNFVNALSGQSQVPNDPGYANRWVSAQFESDQQYRILVGYQNYMIEQESVAGK